MQAVVLLAGTSYEIPSVWLAPEACSWRAFHCSKFQSIKSEGKTKPVGRLFVTNKSKDLDINRTGSSLPTAKFQKRIILFYSCK